ncbi:MAG: hypothetical protein EOP04_28245, partial [Proteobacteria bacterium]
MQKNSNSKGDLMKIYVISSAILILTACGDRPARVVSQANCSNTGACDGRSEQTSNQSGNLGKAGVDGKGSVAPTISAPASIPSPSVVASPAPVAMPASVPASVPAT